MRLTRNFIKIILGVLFIADIALSRTVTHRETTVNANGDKIIKSWTSSDDLDDEHPFERRTVLQKDTTYHMQPHSEHSEILKFGATGIPNDELIRQATLRKGMDPVALEELLRTKQPVVTMTTDDSGGKRTTTYTLEPDGTIVRKTTTEMKPMTFNAPPSNIEPYDEHFFDSLKPVEPNEHVPISDIQRKPTLYAGPKLIFETEPWKDLDDDDAFIKKLKPLDTSKTMDTPAYKPTTTQNNKEWDLPFYEHNSKPIQLPESWNPRNWPNNNKPYFQRPTHNFGTDVHKDPFDGVETNTPGTITKTYVDDNGRTVTSTYTVGPTKVTRKVIKYPMHTFGDFPEWTSTTTKKSTQQPELVTVPSTTQKTATQTAIKNKPEILTTTPLPSLEDFLKTQYGKAKTTTTTARPFNAIATTTPITLKVENIPVSEVLFNGKPVDKNLLGSLPKELRPLPQNPSFPPNTFKVTNIPRQDSHETSSVKTINKTVRSHNLPTNADLDPSMQDILKKAGIDPADIKSIDGDTITKTRTEPDGRIITTTYKVRKVPSVIEPQSFDESPKPEAEPKSTNPFFTRTPQPAHSSHSSAGSIFPTRSFPTYDEMPIYPTYSHKPTFSFNTPHAFQPTMPESPFVSPAPTFNPIEQFLAKIGLTPSDLLAKNGEFSKTIADERGRILTVNFVLSTPIRDREERLENANNGQTQKPIK